MKFVWREFVTQDVAPIRTAKLLKFVSRINVVVELDLKVAQRAAMISTNVTRNPVTLQPTVSTSQDHSSAHVLKVLSEIHTKMDVPSPTSVVLTQTVPIILLVSQALMRFKDVLILALIWKICVVQEVNVLSAITPQNVSVQQTTKEIHTTSASAAILSSVLPIKTVLKTKLVTQL